MKEIKLRRFSFIQRVVINTISLFALAGWFPNGLSIDSPLTGIAAAIVLSILNELVRPFLQLVALPLTLLTFGFFGLVVNAAVLWLTSYVIGAGFNFTSFGWAILFATIMWGVNLIISNYFSHKRKK